MSRIAWLLGLAAAAATLGAAESHLELCGTIPLPGVEGRLDHFALDAKTQRLFLSALENNSLEIVSLREARRLQSISGMKKPTGVAYLPRWDKICVANSDDGTLRTYDAANYQPKQIIHALDQADNVRYDRQSDLVYVGYGKGGLGIVNAAEGQVVAMIPLRGHPEAFAFDHARHVVYVNVPEGKHIAVIDTQKRAVMGTWPVERFPAIYPMALDETNNRLIVGCRKPSQVLVLDTQSGKLVAQSNIAADADDLFFDAKRRRIYVSCGEGYIEVIGQADPDQYQPLTKVATAPGARTSFFSAELDLLAVAVPKRGKQEAEIRLYQPR
jgi:DNA-binding beta-propeller fold protein YncE